MDVAAHFMEIASVLFVAYVGYALGRSDRRVHIQLVAVTVVVAVILHGFWQLALPHDRIEPIARAVARSHAAPTLIVVALLETAGLWIPILMVRWSAPRTRIWTAAYVIGAATLAVAASHAPSFDPPPSHPEYEMWLAQALVFATVPFVIGWATRGGRRLQLSRR